jgi:aminopeptidase
MVRELGFGLNPAISTTTPLRDINFHERKVGIHLSLGKKHGIYGKKLPKTEVQRFHIDVFIALQTVYIGEKQVFENGKWSI